jgi:hypothetical protein
MVNIPKNAKAKIYTTTFVKVLMLFMITIQSSILLNSYMIIWRNEKSLEQGLYVDSNENGPFIVFPQNLKYDAYDILKIQRTNNINSNINHTPKQKEEYYDVQLTGERFGEGNYSSFYFKCINPECPIPIHQKHDCDNFYSSYVCGHKLNLERLGCGDCEKEKELNLNKPIWDIGFSNHMRGKDRKYRVIYFYFMLVLYYFFKLFEIKLIYEFEIMEEKYMNEQKDIYAQNEETMTKKEKTIFSFKIIYVQLKFFVVIGFIELISKILWTTCFNEYFISVENTTNVYYLTSLGQPISKLLRDLDNVIVICTISVVGFPIALVCRVIKYFAQIKVFFILPIFNLNSDYMRYLFNWDWGMRSLQFFIPQFWIILELIILFCVNIVGNIIMIFSIFYFKNKPQINQIKNISSGQC